MEHYKSRTNNFFHFSNPHDDDPWSEIEEEEDRGDGDGDGSYDYHFHPFRTLLDSGCTPTLPLDIQNSRSMNSMDTPNVSYNELRTLNNGELISEIDRTVKKLSVNLQYAIDGLSARILHLDGKTCQLDNAVDDLTNSAEHHHGKVDGKLKQLQKLSFSLLNLVHREAREVILKLIMCIKYHCLLQCNLMIYDML